MTCCFFGHRDAPSSVKGQLILTISELIDNGVDDFYVGHQGKFDYMVLEVLRVMKMEYPDIRYDVTLSYCPFIDKNIPKYVTPEEVYFPSELELVHPKYAISKRNKWMVDESDIVVTYITHPCGSAEKFAEYARKHGKKVINIAELIK